MLPILGVLNSFQSKKRQRKSRTVLVILVHYLFVVYSCVAVKLHFQSANIPNAEQMNKLTADVYSWDEGTGLCPVCVSEISPVGYQYLDHQLDLFLIRNEHFTLTKIFNRQVKHITTLGPKQATEIDR